MFRSRRPVLAAFAAAVALSPAAGAYAAASPTAPSVNVANNVLLTHPGIVHGALNGIPSPPDVAADGWIVADADTGAILAAKRADVTHLPASTLKVLTALAILDKLDPNSEITAPANVDTIDGTRVGLVPGAKYSVRDVATAMLIASGNDAAETLAAAAGGDDVTLQEMRSVAHELQANHTVPGTVSGLDAPGEHTTPYDLALIGRAAINDPIIAPYLTLTKLELSSPGVKPFQIDTHNPLLGVYPGMMGVKAGYTVAAQATYIGAAKQGGHRIIITLMDAYPQFEQAATALLNWGFQADTHVTPVGQLAGLLPPPTQAAPKADVITNATAAIRLPSTSKGSPIGHWALDALAILFSLAAALRLRVKLLMRRRRWSEPVGQGAHAAQSPLSF